MKPEQPLTVALRVRPMSRVEYSRGAVHAAQIVDSNLVVLRDPNEDSDDILRAHRSREKQYVFDHTFGPLSTQAEVYRGAGQGVVHKVMEGYNSTIFAYGATGAGKTYTMLGTRQEPGVMVCTLNGLFQHIEKTKEDIIYHITMAYLEIYNEMIRDLLNPEGGVLDLREDANGTVVVPGLLEVEAESTRDILRLLKRGNQRRICEPTAVNKTSSRSHAILRVTVEQRSRVMNVRQEVKTGVLYLVDLAGSERAAITQNRGKRMVEGAHINRSLLALGNCINALGGNGRAHYVNFRDSKLTRLLKDALSGTCRTVMIAHISPASTSFEESRNTLKYAERAKHIKTKVHQNVSDVSYHITQYHQIIAELRRKVHRLQEQLSVAREQQQEQKQGGAEAPAGQSSEVEELCGQYKALSLDEKEIRQELLALECHLLQNGLESRRHRACIQEWTEHKRLSLSSPTHSLAGHQSTHMEVDLTNEAAAVDHVTSQASHDTHVTLPAVTSDKISTLGLCARELCVSPDSGTELSSLPPTESYDVSSAREELATLVADKQRMEAQHKRVERKLKETRAKMADIQERLSAFPGLHPLQREVIELLQRCSEAEAGEMEQYLVSTLAGVQLTRREGTVGQLLKQSALTLELAEQQRALLEEHGIAFPVDLTVQHRAAVARQKTLTAQVAMEKQLPLMRELHLPDIARLSAKLYTTTTGSKSNLLIDDTLTEGGDMDSRGHTPLTALAASDLHLPGIVNSPLPLSDFKSLVALHPLTSSISLPPLPSSQHTCLVARNETPVTNPIPKSETVSAFLPSLQSMHESSSASSEPERIVSPKKSSHTLLSRVSFATPRISVSRCSSNRSKYIVSQNSKKAILKELEMRALESQSIETLDLCKSRPQPQLTVSKRQDKKSRRHVRGNTTLPLAKPVLSESTQRRLQTNRTVITIEELETLSQCTSNHSTPLHKTGGGAKASPKRSTIPAAKVINRRQPPMAARRVQVPTQQKKPLPRHELMLAKVTAGEQFSQMVSPYLTSARHQKAPAQAKQGHRTRGKNLARPKR